MPFSWCGTRWAVRATRMVTPLYYFLHVVRMSFFFSYTKMCTFCFFSCSKGIYGGALLGVRSVGSLAFHSWDTLELIRRIEVLPKNIYWSENGELLAITSDESFFILRFSQATVDQAFENKDELTEDGVEEAFDVSQFVEDNTTVSTYAGLCVGCGCTPLWFILNAV